MKNTLRLFISLLSVSLTIPTFATSYCLADSNPTFADIISEDVYNAMFPNHNSNYTYQNLLEAVKQFPTFSNEGSLEQRKREAAAFLANIAHETGGLSKVEEGNAYQKPIVEYCKESTTYPCVPNQRYHGRGPLQLSWNYNYKQAGDALNIDLLNNPDLVKNDGVIGFKTALWFWMTPQPPKPSVHAAMIGDSGFGMTINIINGGVEKCGSGTTTPEAQSRIDLYKSFTEKLGVTPGDHLDCNSMKPYH